VQLTGGLFKRPFDIRHGRWELAEIIREMLNVLRAFPNHLGFRIETNAAQAYLAQLCNDSRALRGMGWTDFDIARLKVIPHVTTAQYKFDPIIGVRGMSADFENDKWILPCNAHGVPEPAIQSFIDGMIAFDPMSHTSDFLMAGWLWTEQMRKYSGTSADDLWERYGIA